MNETDLIEHFRIRVSELGKLTLPQLMMITGQASDTLVDPSDEELDEWLKTQREKAAKKLKRRRFDGR